MTSSRRHLLIALILPLLALRVLLPAGFMPVAEGGELRIVMCSEGLQLPTGSDGDSDDHPAPADTGDCPFAQASFNAPPVQFVAFAALPVLTLQFHSSAAEILPPATGPPRVGAARAPPALS